MFINAYVASLVHSGGDKLLSCPNSVSELNYFAEDGKIANAELSACYLIDGVSLFGATAGVGDIFRRKDILPDGDTGDGRH